VAILCAGGWVSQEQFLQALLERDERQREEQRKRDERQRREQLQILRHLTQPQNPWAEMARTSTASDTTSQQGFRSKLSSFYYPASSVAGIPEQVKCAVTEMADNTQGMRVVAAHIWPRSAAATFPLELEDGVNDPSNGIFLHKVIEELFDQLRVCLVCNPFDVSARFVVLDGEIVDQQLAGTTQTFRQLHQKQLKFDIAKRPSFQLLSRHAQQAFANSGNKEWMPDAELSSFKAVVQVGSPAKEEQTD
jgi:hypothetical protein